MDGGEREVVGTAKRYAKVRLAISHDRAKPLLFVRGRKRVGGCGGREGVACQERGDVPRPEVAPLDPCQASEDLEEGAALGALFAAGNEVAYEVGSHRTRRRERWGEPGVEGLKKGDQGSTVEMLAKGDGGLYTFAGICEYLCVNSNPCLMDVLFWRASHRLRQAQRRLPAYLAHNPSRVPAGSLRGPNPSPDLPPAHRHCHKHPRHTRRSSHNTCRLFTRGLLPRPLRSTLSTWKQLLTCPETGCVRFAAP